MNDLTTTTTTTLPALIDQAATALTSAKTSAEVLEARDVARVAYDAAKSAGRMARAKKAHEEVIAAVYRAQAHALQIEARAKMRLADEYDAAQERGEVAKRGWESGVDKHNITTSADLGLRRDEIHEARKLRDVEAAEPGKIARVLNDMAERGEEPTKAKLRREIEDEKPETAPVDPHAAVRKALRALTRDGLEDEVIGLRDENAELRKRVKKQTSDIADLKARIKELEADEKNDVVRALQQKVKVAGNAQWKAEEDLTAWKRKCFILEKRVKELEGMEITL